LVIVNTLGVCRYSGRLSVLVKVKPHSAAERPRSRDRSGFGVEAERWGAILRTVLLRWY